MTSQVFSVKSGSVDTLNCRTLCGASRWRTRILCTVDDARPTVFAKARTVPCVSPPGSCHPEKPLLAAGQPCMPKMGLDWMPIDTER